MSATDALGGHVWVGGYFCECDHELNFPREYLEHLAAVLEPYVQQRVAAALEGAAVAVEDLTKDHWINLANSTDRFLAANYGLVVTVDDLRDALREAKP